MLVLRFTLLLTPFGIWLPLKARHNTTTDLEMVAEKENGPGGPSH